MQFKSLVQKNRIIYLPAEQDSPENIATSEQQQEPSNTDEEDTQTSEDDEAD